MLNQLRAWAVLGVVASVACLPVNAAPVSGSLSVSYDASFHSTAHPDGSYVFNIGGIWNFSNTLTSSAVSAGGWVLTSAVEVFENISSGAIPAGEARSSRRLGAGSAQSLLSQSVVPGGTVDFETALGVIASARTGGGTAAGQATLPSGNTASFALTGLGGNSGSFGIGIQGSNVPSSLGALDLLADLLGLDDSLLFSSNPLPANGQLTGTKTLAAIPLPAALPLLLGGLGAMGALGLRRRRARPV